MPTQLINTNLNLRKVFLPILFYSDDFDFDFDFLILSTSAQIWLTHNTMFL